MTLRSNGCFIIAEAGVNHNGDINLAKKLVDIAKEAEVDAVKFQTWITEDLTTDYSPKADYQKAQSDDETQYQMLKNLELSYDQFIEIKNYCIDKEIIFLSTPDEEKSLDFLVNLGIDLIKIGSGETNNLIFLEQVAKKNLPIILSTGMSDIPEIQRAVDSIIKFNNNLTLLHCTSSYPTMVSDVNMRAMSTIKEQFGLTVGYSDHTTRIDVPLVAISEGAKVIEKHFTFDKLADGPDHQASLSPNELKTMVKMIRGFENMNSIERAKRLSKIPDLETILGDTSKFITSESLENKKVITKSIVSKEFIKKNTKLKLSHLSFKRTGLKTGFSASDYHSVIDKITKKDLFKDEIIEQESLL